jgi:hypothetical protein
MTIERFAADCLDVRDLRRRGFFDGGWVKIGSTLRWPRIARLQIARYAIILDLFGQGVPQRIRVSWTKVHLGGERPWMHCPHCEKRVARLYRGLGGYVCRACIGNPAYAGQGLSAQARAQYKACKLRLHLGGDAHLTTPFPERPRGMHRRTYARLCRVGVDLESGLSQRLKAREPDYRSLVAYLD